MVIAVKVGGVGSGCSMRVVDLESFLEFNQYIGTQCEVVVLQYVPRRQASGKRYSLNLTQSVIPSTCFSWRACRL